MRRAAALVGGGGYGRSRGGLRVGWGRKLSGGGSDEQSERRQRRQGVVGRLMDTEQLKRQYDTLSAQEALPSFTVSLDEYFETLQPNADESAAMERFLKVSEGEELEEEYRLLVTAVREKLRLTVEWNDTSKMTELQRVRATASRVGLTVPEDDQKA